METRGFWLLQGVSDLGLQQGLDQLLASGSRTEARIVAHIAEVERRRLFLKEGFSSLYKYCQLRLGLSETEAWHRLTAARLARKYPVIFRLLEERAIHLSGLCMLRKFLTLANHQELLRVASGKTKQQIETELAARFPGKKVRESMRQLPAKRILPVLASSANSRAAETVEHAKSEHRTIAESDVTAPFPAPLEVVDPTTGEVTILRASECPAARSSFEATPSRSAMPGSTVEIALPTQPSLREPRYRVQFDASAELKAKIELARALSSHANPQGELEMLFERALDVYVEHLQKKRFGKTDKPREKSTPTEVTRARRIDIRSRATGSESLPRERAHISHQTRREVLAKDGLRCAYVSASGQRCGAESFLQLHHEEPWARHPYDEPENLRLFCAGLRGP